MPISSFSDRSGTITLGGTAQTLIEATLRRRGFFLQNTSAGDLWINVGVAAVAASPSIRIPSGAAYETPEGANPAGLVSIIGATTAQSFTCKVW